MSEKLCLKWNDFQDNINATFGKLRNDQEFSDVTLACEDGQQVEAHKVILAASSPFFQNLLRKNKHPHPLVYMRGVKSEDLWAIVDFLYCGEANVYQENIDAFLAIAEELKLKGLTKSENLDKTEEPHLTPFNINKTPLPKIKPKKTENIPIVENEIPFYETEVLTDVAETAVSNFAVASVNITDTQELDEKVRSMMSKSENFNQQGRRKSSCTLCGKEGGLKDIKDHIEANHLDGVSIPCDYCKRTFRTRSAHRSHTKIHSSNI